METQEASVIVVPFILYAVLILLIVPLSSFRFYGALIMVVLIVIAADKARADDFRCALFAREQVRVDLGLDVDSSTLTRDAIRTRVRTLFNVCMVLAPSFSMLEGGAAMREEAWLDDMERILLARSAEEAARIAKLGTVPATDRPAGPEGWAEACDRMWRSFNPEDGTVVRPRSKGGKQRCPLILKDGEWVLP